MKKRKTTKNESLPNILLSSSIIIDLKENTMQIVFFQYWNMLSENIDVFGQDKFHGEYLTNAVNSQFSFTPGLENKILKIIKCC